MSSKFYVILPFPHSLILFTFLSLPFFWSPVSWEIVTWIGKEDCLSKSWFDMLAHQWRLGPKNLIKRTGSLSLKWGVQNSSISDTWQTLGPHPNLLHHNLHFKDTPYPCDFGHIEVWAAWLLSVAVAMIWHRWSQSLFTRGKYGQNQQEDPEPVAQLRDVSQEEERAKTCSQHKEDLWNLSPEDPTPLLLCKCNKNAFSPTWNL